MRIISVVPSITELLYELHLGDEVVGITKFCIHPDQWFRSKTRIGGPKKLNLPLIRQLKPDLIFANKEENIREEIEECETFCRVYVSDVADYQDSLEMIRKTGTLTERQAEANQVISDIEKEFAALSRQEISLKSAVYLIWKDPLMTIGGDTFINDMMHLAGYHNIFRSSKRYPVLSAEELTNAEPEILMLSSEPYPFAEKHVPYFRKLLPKSQILLVDGEMFTWYGSRMRMAPKYFLELRKEWR